MCAMWEGPTSLVGVVIVFCRDVWKIYLEQGQYEMAKKYATGHRDHMDTILVSQAQHYFQQQRLVRDLRLYTLYMYQMHGHLMNW